FGLLAVLLGGGPFTTTVWATVTGRSTPGTERAARFLAGVPSQAGRGSLADRSTGQSSTSSAPSAAASSPLEPEKAVPEIDYPNTHIALPGGTTVSPEQFFSTTLGMGTWYEIVLPPGYAQSRQRYPVLYMLHGAMGGAAEWLEIGIHQTADRLWAEGTLPPFIIVLPEGGNSYFLNHANGGPR